MLLLDAQTFRYVDVNQTAIDVYGYTREQFLEMTPYDLRAPATSTASRRRIIPFALTPRRSSIRCTAAATARAWKFT